MAHSNTCAGCRPNQQIQFIHGMFPIRIFKKFFFQESGLRWRPKGRITQPDVGRQRRMRRQKALDSPCIGRQTQLAEKL